MEQNPSMEALQCYMMFGMSWRVQYSEKLRLLGRCRQTSLTCLAESDPNDIQY